MAEQRFTVVFRGRLVEGADGVEVRANIAKLFKLNPAKVDAMFTGKPVLIKKDLDPAKAEAYRAALAKAGAVAELVAADAPQSAPAAAAPQSEPQAAAEPNQARGEASAAKNPPQAPDLTVAEPGVTLVEHAPIPPAEFDTTQFDLAEVGVTLVEPKTVPPAEFDTSGLALDPPGTDLTEPRAVPPADFDTSGLTLADQD